MSISGGVGTNEYTYFDPVFPYQIDYTVFEPDAGANGLVVVTRLAHRIR